MDQHNIPQLLERLQRNVAPFITSRRLCIAYSGGLDSHVLIHALSQSFAKNKLYAIHVDHRWHPEAGRWAEHCQIVCQRLGIANTVLSVDARAQRGQSPEAYARQIRYRVLSQQLQLGDCLLTAHHLDDQAETLLLQLFRGAGTKGLASMPIVKWDGHIYHLRPLLTCTRGDLLAYARYYRLQWVEDSSNLNLSLDRNFVRHHLLPQIRQRWPRINKIIARTAAHCAESVALLEQMAQADYTSVQGTVANTLSVRALLALMPARRRNVLRYWLQQSKLTLPTQKQLQQIEHTVLLSKSDACPKVEWASVTVRRYRDDLYTLPHAAYTVAPLPAYWDLEQVLCLPALGKLIAKQTWGQGIRCSLLPSRQVVVSLRKGGERFRPAGRRHSRSLKKLLQEWRVPVWERPYVPLIYYQDQLLAVVGYGIASHAIAHKDELGFKLEREAI